MAGSLSLSLALPNANLLAGVGDDPPEPGAVQLLVSQADIGNATYWQASRLSVSGPSAGPQGTTNAWEAICSGESDPLLLQAPLPPVSLVGRSLMLRVWAKSGTNTEGYSPGFQFFSYDTLFAGGIDQVQNQEKAITASWARYEFEVAFTTWAEGDLVTWRIDPYDITGGTNQPIAGASIFIAKPELWLLPV
jgi:hypothetical protein